MTRPVKLALVGLTGFFALAILVGQGRSNDLKQRERDAIRSAIIDCELAVTPRLKAPATADFPPYYEAKVSDLGDGRYRMVSYVDAQNSFGAKTRSRYLCTAGKGQVENVVIDG